MNKSPYRKVLDELSYDKGVLVRGTKVLMPGELDPRAVALAHEGHKGIEATLRNLRDKVWFPDMSKRVQEYVQSCLGCVARGWRAIQPPAPITTRTPMWTVWGTHRTLKSSCSLPSPRHSPQC